jgi:quercetin dioxygenase-like cupin family protein
MAGPDAVQADPKHYTVESEDDRVRVLRIRYGAGEKSVMHTHPAVVVVPLTDVDFRFHLEDGTTQELQVKAGEVQLMPATTHLPENVARQPFEAILVELKG